MLIIFAVVLFGLIIFFHEGGHFITAKIFGIKVNEFSIGMGPKLFSFTKGETTYSLRLLPIGGYCAMEGEDEDNDNPRAFNNAKVWKRLIVIIAGAVMNIIFGLVLMAITLIPQQQFASTEISAFSYYSYTQQSGLQQGDKIVKLNDYGISSSTDFSFAIYTMPLKEVDGHSVQIYKQDCSNSLCDHFTQIITKDTSEDIQKDVYAVINEGVDKISITNNKEEAYNIACEYIDKMDNAATITLTEDYPEIVEKDTRERFRTDITVERNGERVELKDVDFLTTKSEDQEKPSVSIDFYVQPIEKNIGTYIAETCKSTVSVVRMVYASLIGLVKGQFGINEVSGPVGLVSAVTTVAQKGLETGILDALMGIIYVMMVISVNLGVVNMLPFPALDGGRFLFLLIEAIFKKPIPRKVERIVNSIGLGLLLLLTAVITVKDVFQLFNGGFNINV